jgi:hypothetical protein
MLRDWTRIDIIEDDDGKLYVIDANTQPSLGHPPERIGLFAESIHIWTGASYEEVVECLIGVGLSRYGFGKTYAIQTAMENILHGKSEAI